MKKYLILFITLVTGLSFWIVYNDFSHNELQNIREIEGRIAEPFMIPNDWYLVNPNVTIPILQDTASGHGVNIFRNSQMEIDEINKFIYLSNETRFWDEITVRNDEVVVFGNRANVNIYELEEAFTTLMVAGRYYAELPHNVSLEDFLETFVYNLNVHFELDFETDDLFTIEEFLFSNAGGMTFHGMGIEIPLLVVLAFITLIIGIYYVASQSKKISIMKLNGLKILTIWQQVVGKTVISSAIILSGISIVIAVVIGLIFHNYDFVQTVAIRQIIILIGIITSSLLICLVIKRIHIGLGVKNKNSKKFIFGFNTIIKLGLTVLVLVLGSEMWNQFIDIREQEQSISSWAIGEDFGVFPYLMIGNDVRGAYDGAVPNEIAMQVDLYPILNEMGSIFINARSFEEWDLEVNGTTEESINRLPINEWRDTETWRRMRVNPNYLNAFPILDTNGEVINISEDEKRVIFLVPEHYQDAYDELMDFFTDTRMGMISGTRGWLRTEVPEAIANAEIQIIWTQSNQNIFSFNPDVFPDNNNYIIDPIMQVVTIGNGVGADREIILGGGARDPIKVNLINGSTSETFEYLYPILIELELNDNLPHLVTVNESVLSRLAELQTMLNILLGGIAVITFVTVALSLQNIVLYFNQKRQKFIINRVFGTSFAKTYGKFINYFVILWILQIGASFIGMTLFNDEGVLVIVVILFFILVDGLLSIIMIRNMERKNKMAVLKGDA